LAVLVVTATDALTPQGFDAVQMAFLESEIRIFPMRAWWPSALGHPCDRQIVWSFNRAETKSRYPARLQSIFDEGKLHHPAVYRRLEQMGFVIVRESDRPAQYRPVPGVTISGKPDGRIIGFGEERYRPAWSLEIKTTSPYVWNRLHTIDDLRQDRDYLLRQFYTQGHVGAFLDNLPRGVFVLKDKLSGMLKLLPFELDYAHAEGYLERAERLQPLIDQGVDPEPISYDETVCGRCGFLAQCYPPRSFGEGASFLDDPALVEQLEERERLAPSSSAYEKIDKAIKSRLKAEGVKFAIAGQFTIEGRVSPRREFTVKAQDVTTYTITRLGTA
jgi:hypothetical protein